MTSNDEQPGQDTGAIELAHRLFDAARAGDLPLLRSYVDAGVPADLTNSAGDSLLMLAAYNGHAPVVDYLVGRGADVNALNDRGQSPLAGAVFKGYADVVRSLVAAGADAGAGQPSAIGAAGYFGRQDLLGLLRK
ncbi:ankyrin repeat domain-containing protein [Arthrobacter deserti]|uniref:Ankyrin repeat domain-containing protein n=1 Tax=Arthrobacter deserti TaxID=1742687 RepID=A0ABX1JSN0_9MICC|nr:ankyrin repeat domain-containing protein [Arthrobacter deserti]